MKSLHKKIGVVALSSALVMGGAFAGASISQAAYNRLKIEYSNYKSQSLKLPFLVKYDLYRFMKSNPRKVHENDVNMIIGFSDIFDYQVSSINSAVNDESAKSLKNFEDANEFLAYISNNNVEEGKYKFKVGRQDVIIQFMDYSPAGKKWWLELDKWIYIGPNYLKSAGFKINY